jgi:hypothetical protein
MWVWVDAVQPAGDKSGSLFDARSFAIIIIITNHAFAG